MEVRLDAMEPQIALLPTSMHIEKYVKEEIEKTINVLHELLKKMPHGDGQKKTMNIKDASGYIPRAWTGTTDKTKITEYIDNDKNWADILCDSGVELLELVERNKEPVDERDIDNQLYLDAKKCSLHLYHMLSASLQGAHRKFGMNVARGAGLAAWRDIVDLFDPKTPC